MNDLIHKQEAINAVIDVCRNYTPTQCTVHPHIDCIVEALEMLPTRGDDGWVPCSERLPDVYGTYLVSYRTESEPDLASFDPDSTGEHAGEWCSCDANGFYWVINKGLEVVAWMELPHVYRKE